MTTSAITREAVARELTDATVRTLRAISTALAAGVILFLGVALFLAVTSQAQPGPGSAVPLLAVLSALLAPTAWGAALLVPRQLLARAARSARDAAAVVTALRTAHVVRLALTEAPALFAIVIILMGGLDGTLRASPLLWLALAPVAVHLSAVARTWPSRESMLAQLDDARTFA